MPKRTAGFGEQLCVMLDELGLALLASRRQPREGSNRTEKPRVNRRFAPTLSGLIQLYGPTVLLAFPFRPTTAHSTLPLPNPEQAGFPMLFPPSVIQPVQVVPLNELTQSAESDSTTAQPNSEDADCAQEGTGLALAPRLPHPVQLLTLHVPPLKSLT
jgi:hypothetical protein